MRLIRILDMRMQIHFNVNSRSDLVTACNRENRLLKIKISKEK